MNSILIKVSEISITTPNTVQFCKQGGKLGGSNLQKLMGSIALNYKQDAGPSLSGTSPMSDVLSHLSPGQLYLFEDEICFFCVIFTIIITTTDSLIKFSFWLPSLSSLFHA